MVRRTLVRADIVGLYGMEQNFTSSREAGQGADRGPGGPPHQEGPNLLLDGHEDDVYQKEVQYDLAGKESFEKACGSAFDAS
jgi:hypothetical protein